MVEHDRSQQDDDSGGDAADTGSDDEQIVVGDSSARPCTSSTADIHVVAFHGPGV